MAKRNDSGERVLSPGETVAFLRRAFTKLRWMREQTARRDAALARLGLKRAEREAIIDSIRAVRPDLPPTYVASLAADRLVYYLELVERARAEPQAGGGAKKGGRPKKGTPSTNDRMLALLTSRPESHFGTRRQWCDALGCAPSTAGEQPAWRKLAELRQAVKAERALEKAKINSQKPGVPVFKTGRVENCKAVVCNGLWLFLCAETGRRL